MLKTFDWDSDILHGVNDPALYSQDMIMFILLDSDSRHDTHQVHQLGAIQCRWRSSYGHPLPLQPLLLPDALDSPSL